MALSPIRKRQLNSLLRRYGTWPKQIALMVLCCLLASALYLSSFGIIGNIQVLRFYFFLRGPVAPPDDVVIVAIDDRSFRELEASTSYPLPRRYLATSVEAIVDAKPRMFFVDMKFPDDRVFDEASDLRLAGAFAKAPTTIWSGREDDLPGTEPLPSGEHFRKAAKMELDMFIEGGQGYLFGASDSDSRGVHLSQDAITPSSPPELKKKLRERSQIGYALVELGGYSIIPPTTDSFINFYGPSKSIRYLSAVDLIKGDVAKAKEQLRDKVVLLGYLSKQYMKGILNRDEFFVPADRSGMFGVEIHSHLVANLVHNQWIARLDPVDELSFVVVFIMAFVAAAVRKPTPTVIGFVILTPVLLLCIGYVSLVYFRFYIPGIPVIAVMAYLITAPSIIHFLLRSQRFNRYLNKQMKIDTEHEI